MTGSDLVMRLGVLDIGSNAAHLRITDVTAGHPPLPVATLKRQIRLAEEISREGVIGRAAIDRLTEAVGEAVAVAAHHRVHRLLPFATSAVRDAANREPILAEIQAATGVRVGYLDAVQEARLTFLAVRHWYGWSAGPILLADIGGGSMELAYGTGETPELALSLPLGAGRLTRHRLPDPDRVKKKHRRRLREHVESVLARSVGDMSARHRIGQATAVATSRTFYQLARLCGAPKAKAGPQATRELRRDDLREAIELLAGRTPEQRAQLPGVSAPRARQILAGAIVADATLAALDLPRVRICPWALREGILLDQLHHSARRTRHLAAIQSQSA
ncbi:MULTISPECIES: Ppx/GppA phosphatase family protein [unclassified Nonomuraea]|uniref:Ppx/GppA phosphatase family protein n=1 Tax=unclassified Nonomuraea TaxID=2593643 RepID=UPI0035BFBF7B